MLTLPTDDGGEMVARGKQVLQTCLGRVAGPSVARFGAWAPQCGFQLLAGRPVGFLHLRLSSGLGLAQLTAVRRAFPSQRLVRQRVWGDGR